MNKYFKIFISSLFIITLFSYCDKENKSDYGTLKVKLNGDKWTGKVNVNTGIVAGKFSIGVARMIKMEGVYICRDQLNLSFLRRTKDHQTLLSMDSLATVDPVNSRTSASFGTTQDDGDVLCDQFEVIDSESANNYLLITKEDNNFSEIWGKFAISLKKTVSCAESEYPDIIRFTDGEFHVFLK